MKLSVVGRVTVVALYIHLGILALTLVLLMAPFASEAQQAGKVSRIGVLSGSWPPPRPDPCLDRLRQGFADLGHVEGRTYVLEPKWAEGLVNSYPRLAADLVRLNVDVIVSFTSPGHPAAKQATSTIPIVMASGALPVERGLVSSLARPGGNITGFATITREIFGKRLQLFREAIPLATRVAVLRLEDALQDLFVTTLQSAARQLGVRLQVLTVRRPEDLPGAFQAAVRDGAQGIMTTQGPFFARTLEKTAELALRHRLPSFSGEEQAAPAGILMSYGPRILETCYGAARFVDRILKGARPGDLPVEQPTTFTMRLNLKTAKALGLTLPSSLLLQAGQVIE